MKKTAIISGAALCSFFCLAQQKTLREEYDAFYYGQKGDAFAHSFTQSIIVVTPSPGAYVKGDFTVVCAAPGMKNVKVFCWRQPDKDDAWADGRDELLAELQPRGVGRDSFVVRADTLPSGPMTLRFHAEDGAGRRDYYELQLFNLGGKVWRQGIPAADPPGAQGMRLVFADDFDAPLSISPDGLGARYAAHKTGGGDFSGWPFSDPAGDKQPFSQEGTYLRIHASKPLGTKGRSGILSSLRADGTGVCVPIPSYFECRFVAHSAPGTWPAFWTLTKGTIGLDKTDPRHLALAQQGTDELDIIEAYGGYGVKNPNSRGLYSCTSHFWNQNPQPAWSLKKLADGAPNPDARPTHFRADTLALGEKSSWSWTPHTYGLAITETDTIYYFDNIEIGRHPTGPVSKTQPAWFLINHAIGGISGWQIDLERYGNVSDMWVDFVRVYCGRALSPDIRVAGFVGARPALVTLSCETPDAIIRYTLDGTEPTVASPVYTQPFPVSAPATVTAIAFVNGLKPSLPAQAAATAPPGVPGSVGISFAAPGQDGQELGDDDLAGIGAEAQANWNRIAPGTASAANLRGADGAVVNGLALNVTGDARAAAGESWGFSGNASKLRRGAIQPAPVVTLTGIPYKRYDIVVFLGAGVHAMQGTALIKKASDAPGEVDAKGAYAFDFNWQSGKDVMATRAAGESSAGATYVRFTGNTAPDIELHVKATKGQGWIGISGVQILPVGKPD